MVATDKLKKYAIKIFNGDSDYSLQKAYRLFRKYFTKIAFYYTEILSQKQEELTRRTIQQLGYIKAVEMRKIAASANRYMIIYKNKVINDLRTLEKNKKDFYDDEAEEADYDSMRYDKNIQIYKDILVIYEVNKKALRAVEKTAQKYRYNEIFTEASTYLIKNEDIYWQIAYALKDYRERIESFYQFFLYKTEI